MLLGGTALGATPLIAQEHPVRRVANIVSVAVEEYGKGVDARGVLTSEIEFHEASDFLADAKTQAARLTGDRAAVARILGPGGEFRFATDIPDYAAWTLKHLTQSPALAWTAERADDWRRPWPGFGRALPLGC